MKIILDTNAYSDWRTNGRWGKIIATADQVFMPVIVLGELRYSFEKGTKGSENKAKLITFLNHPRVSVLNIGETTSQCFAKLKHYLSKAGTPIPENDVWISALGVEHGLAVVTGDSHFDFLPQVGRVLD